MAGKIACGYFLVPPHEAFGNSAEHPCQGIHGSSLQAGSSGFRGDKKSEDRFVRIAKRFLTLLKTAKEEVPLILTRGIQSTPQTDS